jgi:MerR family transcriptional regulator, light-induced transcriptional regulator
MREVDKGGQSLSATDFAALTGVSRERLRTWERRHGFPVPLRAHSGPRRYAVEDVTRVVAVRRAVESGVPLPAAIAATDVPPPAGLSPVGARALAEQAPVAVVALSGPEPLRVEYVNAAVRGRPGAPGPGDDLLALAPWFAAEPGARTLRRLFSDDIVAAACEHPDWTAGLSPGAHSIAYRLPPEEGRPPLVALIGVDTSHERRARKALAEAERDREQLRATVERDARFGAAAGAVADLFRLQGGPGALGDATALLVRRLGAVDAAIAPYMTGSLVLGRSARGLLGPEMVTVTRYADLADAVRDGETAWLDERAAGGFGAPEGVALLVVPLMAAGELLGALLLLFDERTDLDQSQARLLRTISAVLAFALLREQVAAGAVPAPPGG